MTILIDDNVENCQQFIANGGMAIQYIDSEWDRMETEIKEIVMKKLQESMEIYPQHEVKKEHKKIVFDRTTKRTKIS